jgi:plastocyanin
MVGAGRLRAVVAVALSAWTSTWALAWAPPALAAPELPADWPGDDFPLPLQSRTAQDLAFKSEAERQYLIFNLMTGGKRAFEAGDFARAMRKWDALLRVPNLPPEVTRVVQPLLEEAQQAAAAGGVAVARAAEGLPLPPIPPSAPEAPSLSDVPRAPEPTNVSGIVSGGGAVGPGGTVLWLRRLDGPTPPVRPLRKPKVVSQKDKVFIPRVVAVPVGSKVDFRNDDPYYHNVFSLSDAEKFDTGLYAGGRSYVQSFEKPGPVELLCNIHASMVGYVVVVDTPYYTQPRGNGAFLFRSVPPGRYELSAWHEASAKITKQTVLVRESGASGVVVKIPSDRVPLVVVPDKYGKPRQPQLGY